MARHVLGGEFPAFFWGQPFKGLIEVYASADRKLLFATGIVTGLALWEHQLIVFYLIPLGMILAIRGRWYARRAIAEDD